MDLGVQVEEEALESNNKQIDSEVQAEDEALETNLIDDIDAQGYLITNSDSDVEVEKRKDLDMDFGFAKEVANNVIGQVFDNPDKAYDFYNRYALLDGFGILIASTFRNKTTNEPYRRKYVCNKEGYKDLKRDNSKGEIKRRRDLRTGCKAFLRISKGKDGKWLADEFNDTDNHELIATPTKVMKHRSHGKFHRSCNSCHTC